MTDDPVAEREQPRALSREALFAAHEALASFLQTTVAPALETILTAAQDHGPELVAWATELVELEKRLRHWEINAPRLLIDGLAGQALIVPMSRLSFRDVVELLAACERGGPVVAVSMVRGQYDAIFADDGLDAIERDWANDPRLAGRMPILRDALAAHRAGLYGASVPTLIAQFDGYVVDINGHVGRVNGEQLRELVEKIADDPSSWEDRGLRAFVADILHTKFKFGDTIPAFSRHAILHGADLTYGTETKSRTAILLFDQLCTAARGSP